MRVVEVDEKFQPRHDSTLKGFIEFIGEISSVLEEVNMTVKTGKEETGTGKSWVALVSYCFLVSSRHKLT